MTKEKKSKNKMTVSGTFIGNAKGFGFVRSEELEEDIFIPEDAVNGALQEDTVEAEILSVARGRRMEGRVVKILARGITKVVGTYQKSKNYGFVIPDNRKYTRDIFIEKGKDLDAADGDKVVAEILSFAGKNANPTGKITEDLGAQDKPGTDILSIARDSDLPMDFPVRAINQAERISEHILPSDFEGREDLRKWRLVTIDGPDAKDLDDAVSLTKDGDFYELGVHIADVSNYVQDHSALDREALKRGTSVYLADRVIPMLPQRLSNGICSLNAGEDRLALSVIMTLDAKGKVTEHRIAETVIRVGERMSYPDVRAILEDEDPVLTERYHDYVPMFRLMLELSGKIRARRAKRGAIDFDFPEAKILLDEKGIPTEIKAEEANCATKLIEDFMLTANETVAEEYKKRKIPFVYRVHEDPDPDKVNDLLAFVRKQGVQIDRKKTAITPKEIQEALKRIEGTSQEGLISRVILRSMQQARYTTECSGHFGLAAKYYCHFTSPIRRYPDLQIHRIIKDTIRGRMNEAKTAYYEEILDDVAQKSSAAERRADDVERETEKLKKAQYMQMHIGETFAGVISGVTSWGVYVELENTVEGLVHMQELRDDYYEYDPENHLVFGRLGGKTYSLGDSMQIRVLAADTQTKTIDFEPAENPYRPETAHTHAAGSGKAAVTKKKKERPQDRREKRKTKGKHEKDDKTQRVERETHSWLSGMRGKNKKKKKR